MTLEGRLSGFGESAGLAGIMHRTLLFYKPYGVLTQFTDESGAGRPTLKDYIPVADVYAAGRLDLDSEGLLLLTTDGDLQHRLTDPRFAHPRTYWAQVEGTPVEDQMRQLREGVVIQDRRTLPAAARILEREPEFPPRNPPIRFRKLIPTAWIELTLTEGRNRQVRRMTAAVGLPTLRLVRVALGQLRIDGMAPGEWRDLRPMELRSISPRISNNDSHGPTPPTGANRGRGGSTASRYRRR